MAAVHFDIKDVITICIAVVGAVLGVINTWHALDQRRVRLRVVPKTARFFGGGETGPPMGCIEVVNLSAFPISIHEIGFTTGGDPRKEPRFSVAQPITTDHQPFARTLEPRHSVTGYFELRHLSPNIEKAYAMTECGEVAYGTSPALLQIQQRLRSKG